MIYTLGSGQVIEAERHRLLHSGLPLSGCVSELEQGSARCCLGAHGRRRVADAWRYAKAIRVEYQLREQWWRWARCTEAVYLDNNAGTVMVDIAVRVRGRQTVCCGRARVP